MIWLIFSIVFFLYGFSVGYKNSGTFFYIIWFVFSLFSFGMYKMDQFHMWEHLPSIWLQFFLVICALSALVVLSLLVCVLSSYFSKGIEKADYIIILGAQWKEKGPSKALKFRLDTALEYLKKNPSTLCIVSGGQGYNEPCSEAHGMAEYLIQHGIKESRIFKEDQSTSTIENIQMSKRFLPSLDVSICIVSNAFHIFRAVSIAKKQGLMNAVGLSARSDLWYLPNNALREVFGIIKDYLAHNLDF
ncbi:MAG: YdcF family protein [Firmicutes bacterium]|nr:YdcF family protein [Bacillota bacterium]